MNYTYVHSGQRPYFNLFTRNGVEVTGVRPPDHPWHTGLSLAIAHVGAANFWGGPTFVRNQGYVQLPNNGTMRHDGFDHRTVEGFRERLTWLTEPGEHVASEIRTVETSTNADHWSLDFATEIRNTTTTPLIFGSPTTNGRPDAGYGGLLWRGPASFTGGRVLGARMGEFSRWLAFVTPQATLVFLAPTPTCWFVRSEPFAAVCPAPFFHEEVALAANAVLRLRYRVVIADGAWDEHRIRACRPPEGGGLFSRE
ncbi:hypothetical protein Lesp02_69680 [Lentzea sp. NBRC 105346]|uniref:DUF6807 domain-containing protein n=1 Tax=Lentzea sp. NBRC 105346 TaxID=3032205 RepID=UPI0024A27DF8|nr:PmoA family protein [Lentzea sp. NBRC 105346]GLZ34781.1 hypothetical protein Lesp02_69680 [Lentzea sp. NBRC 105346]